MFKLNKIKHIHLEITDRCNASCPQCARNVLGGKENPELPNKELNFEDVRIIFPPAILKNLKRIYACGNYGDPAVAKDTLLIFEYFRKENQDLVLGMNTNGGVRPSKWWADLAKIIGGKGDIKFGIDGLADTNHLYRRNVDFNRVIENAEAFIRNGGRASWEFIAFKHNEHQIEEARKLSQKLGFEKFTVKKTGRFFSNTKLKGKDRQEVLNTRGEVEYFLEKPENPELQNSSLLKENRLIEEFGSLEKYLDQTIVNCKTLQEGSIYLSSEGLVFPCCWTGNQLYLWYNRPKSSEIWKILDETGGVDRINAKLYPIEKILQGDFFQRIQKSWECFSIEKGKLKVCAKTCGENFNQFKDQYL